MSRRIQFETIRSEGALLPPDLLQRLVERDKDLDGLRGEDYGLPPNEPVSEAIVRSYNRMVGAWGSFQEARAKLPDADPGTSITRDRLLLVLLQELGYGRVQTEHAIEIEGRAYPISHAWEKVPIHLLGCNVPLGVRTKGVAGASSQSPHGTLQELLNRSEERLWGIVSNGLELRLLRDNSSLTRQAFVSFDLEQMFDGDIYADFALLWMLCHASRVEGERPHECWLERWSQEAERQGTRALEGLRSGVEEAISALGSGFLRPGRNAELKAALRAGELSTQDYYRELLRLVYRVLFLFVAEDRKLLHHPEAFEQAKEHYAEWYSSARLRRLAERRRGTKHGDLWESLSLVMSSLGKEAGETALGLPALGSFLWSREAIAHLEGASLSNGALLDAIRSLATVKDGKVLRSVDYKNLGAEELGSVYESLLELHPELDLDAGTFTLTTAAGNERRTTGSYYTPSSLISCLLDSALDPVLDEAAAKGEEAMLDLKIVDPACGSGHFLVAAAHRIAKRLASVRTGDEEPSPEATRTALRDVIGRCVYGVDMNPMAVELCKISLWMEALDPGRPLNFLDGHIKCGNSLLGTTLELINNGIPDDAFKPIEGDDKEIAKSLRKQNKTEREGQLTIEDLAGALVNELEAEAAALEETADDSFSAVQEKERLFAALSESEAYGRARLTADAWCAAFVQRKVKDAPRVSTGVVRRLASGRGEVAEALRDEVERLARQYGFFHWEVEFPHVFGGDEGGFDVVIGNPPWERIKLDEKEYFAGHPYVSSARNAADRRRRIEQLEAEDPDSLERFRAATRTSEGGSHFVRSSNRYPLSGRGDVNTYGLFGELMRSLSHTQVGCVIPMGLVTDDNMKVLFQEMMRRHEVRAFHAFDNSDGIFPAVKRSTRFGLLTLDRRGRDADVSSDFVFYARSIGELSLPDRHIALSFSDLSLFNPNTFNCPTFMSKNDEEVNRQIYGSHQVISQDGVTSPWSLRIRRVLDMNKEEVLSLCQPTEGRDVGTARVPVYEAKLMDRYDHRAATYVGASVSPTTSADRRDPDFRIMGRYAIPTDAVRSRLRELWSEEWLLAWQDITDVNTMARSVSAAILPYSGTDFTLRIGLPGESPVLRSVALLANLNSFCFDYLARQKIGGTHLSDYVLKQLPAVEPERYEAPTPWDPRRALFDWVSDRVLELTFTGSNLAAFAGALGRDGPAFQWDEGRRELLLTELDAAFFHLYGLSEKDVDYVMGTFEIIKRKDEQKHGHYRTKSLIVDAYRRMSDAIDTGVPYETILDPPPADPRVAHQPLAEQPVRQAVETT